MPTLLALVFGSTAPATMLRILVPGMVSGVVVGWVLGISSLPHIVIVLATIDIVSGCISNATRATRYHWQQQSRMRRYIFVGIHLVLYPYALWLLPMPTWLFSCLLILLGTKISLFGYGQRATTSPSQP